MPTWLWAQKGGGAAFDQATDVTTDMSGNVLCVGSFGGDADFGAFHLVDSGSSDAFLVKYNASGTVTWARGAGGSLADIASGIASDLNGNIYVCGYFYSPAITFDTLTLVNPDTTGNTRKLFLAKYDPAGNILWATRVGEAFNARARGLCIDASGCIYVAGDFADPSLVFGNDTLVNHGDYDMCLLKFDPSGNAVWGRSFGGMWDEYAIDVASDQAGRIALLGFFSTPVMTIGASTLMNAGFQDIVLAELDTAGNNLWAVSAGGSESDIPLKVCMTAEGKAYVTGQFASPVMTCGALSIANYDSTLNMDMFVACTDSLGNFVWAHAAGGAVYDGGNDICSDGLGGIYVTGYFEDSTISFGSHTLSNSGAIGSDEIFVVKYDTAGNVAWTQSAGGISYDDANCITTATGGYLYVAGLCNDTCTFGSNTISSHATGDYDAFVSKLDFSTGLPVLASPGRWLLNPNPNQGSFMLTTTRHGSASLQVYNLLGQAIYQGHLSGPGSFSVDPEVPPGLYLAHLLNDDGTSQDFQIIRE